MKPMIYENKLCFDECNCCFDILPDGSLNFIADLHNPNHTISFHCKKTYKNFCEGLTEGIFQLTSKLGNQFCKKVAPESLEHLSALGAILRPGAMECVSGDTKIYISNKADRPGRKYIPVKMKISDLYGKFHRKHSNTKNQIISYDETNYKIFTNTILDMFYNGKKHVYRPKFKIRKRVDIIENRTHTLECTLDHKLLTHDKGWVKLSDIKLGQRVAITNLLKYDTKCTKNQPREKSFRDVCYAHYDYKCIFCDWQDGSLDVNHIDGNRKTNNSPENLCFLCPNHHRIFTEGNISKEEVIIAREKYKLIVTTHICWAEFCGYDYIGEKDVYDISVEGPNNNYIAGGVVVHNCKDENGISTTIHYERRKNSKEETPPYHPIVDRILKKTYNLCIYQESMLALAQEIAGFSLVEADILRRGVSKKQPETIAKCKKMFIEKGIEKGILTKEQLEEVWGWIEASQRYAFNKAHSMAYGITAYVCQYIKTHFPLQFYCQWLNNEKDRLEYEKLVNEAKLFNISVYTPDIRDWRTSFYIKNKNIFFGLHEIKGLVKKDLDSLARIFGEKEWRFADVGTKISWLDFLSVALENISSKTAEGLILSGSLDPYNIDRARMLCEYEIWSQLTATEKSLIIENIPKYIDVGLDSHILRLIKEHEDYYNIKTEQYNDKVAKRKNSTRKRNKEPKPLVEPKENRRLAVLREIYQELTSPLYNVVDTIDSIIFAEENLLGVALTKHKTDEIALAAETGECMDILKGDKSYKVLRVKIEQVREYKCKNGASAGRNMIFMEVSDKSGRMPAIAFPDVVDEYKHLLTRGNLVFISGEKSKDSFVVKRVYSVS